MANTIDTDLNVGIVLDAALEAYTAALAPLMAFSTDFTPDGDQKYADVSVGFIPAASAAQDFAGTYTMQDSTWDARKMSLDQHKFVSMFTTDSQAIKSPVVSLQRQGRQKGFQLAKAVWQDILSLVVAANFSGVGYTGAASAFDSDDVVDIKQACDSADWGGDRSLILASEYFNALLKDGTIKSSDSFGGSEAIRQGKVPFLSGFDMYSSTIIPGNAENLVGFAATPEAIGIVMRYLNPQAPEDLLDARAVTDPESGITFGYREWYDRDSGEKRAVLESLYGRITGNGNAIQRVVSA